MELEAIRAELERVDGDIADLESKKKAVETQLAPKLKERDLLRALCQLREAQGASAVPGELPFQKESEGIVSTPVVAAENKSSGYGAKAKAMRSFVLSRNGGGVTMRELINEAARIGAREQFPYQWANRQRKVTPPRLEKRGKRFFATEKMKELDARS